MIMHYGAAVTVAPYSLCISCILEKPLVIGGGHDYCKNKKMHKNDRTRVVRGTGGALLKLSGTGPHTPPWYVFYMGTQNGKINNL